MESNSCLSDEIKPHFPPPLNAKPNPPKQNENHVLKNLESTNLSEMAKEAFFHARNIGMTTFVPGLQPARLEDGTQPVKIVPDYTENATIDSVFVPPTMNCTGAIPYGPDLYAPLSYTKNHSTNSALQSSAPLLPSNPNAIEMIESALPNGYQQQPINKSNFPVLSSESHNNSPSSGYVSSPGDQSMLPSHHSKSTSYQQLENHNSPLQYTYPHDLNTHKSSYQSTPTLPPNHVNNPATASHFADNDDSMPKIDLSVFENVADNDSLVNSGPVGSNRFSDKSNLINAHQVKPSQQRPGENQNDNGLSPFNYANSSIDNIIDQLIRQIPDNNDDLSSYPDLPNLM